MNIEGNRLQNNYAKIKEILENLFNEQIRKMEKPKLQKLEQIPEYKFKLIKISITLKSNKKFDVFLKLTNENKINETIFCYWYFCEEKYKFNINENSKYNKKANIKWNQNFNNLNDSKGKAEVEILNKNNKICKNSNVYFLELKNSKKEKAKSIKMQKKENILFIGVI